MANETKACSLTENEIYALLRHHGSNLAGVYFNADDISEYINNNIERINYLNKRLKAFNEPETETKPTPAVAGWGTPTT